MSLNSSLGVSYILFTTLHVALFILAAIVAGLYGADLARAKGTEGWDSRWAFAVVVASLSAVTTCLYCIPFVLRFAFLWVWNLVLFILWITVFGVFGKMYIHDDRSGIGRMKAAVWIDLANALLWLVATLAALGYWLGHRERRTRFTGRAKVY